MSNIEVNNEWRAAITAIEGGKHVYVTGAADRGGVPTGVTVDHA